jgi:hypothetical protein
MSVADKKKRTTKPKKVEIATVTAYENVKLSISEIEKVELVAPKFKRDLCLCNYIPCEYQPLRNDILELQNRDFLTMDALLKDDLLKKMFTLYLLERKYRTLESFTECLESLNA